MKSHIVVNAMWLSPSSTLTESECNKTHNPQLHEETEVLIKDQKPVCTTEISFFKFRGNRGLGS